MYTIHKFFLKVTSKFLKTGQLRLFQRKILMIKISFLINKQLTEDLSVVDDMEDNEIIRPSLADGNVEMEITLTLKIIHNFFLGMISNFLKL